MMTGRSRAGYDGLLIVGIPVFTACIRSNGHSNYSLVNSLVKQYWRNQHIQRPELA